MSNNKIIEFPINQKGLTDFFQLTKLRLSISVVMSSMAGYFLAVDIIDFSHYSFLQLEVFQW